MTAEELGRRTLALDASYCAAAGAFALLARRALARLLGVGPALVGAAGGATIGWAALLATLTPRSAWRPAVLPLAAGNLAAASALLALAAAHPRARAQLLLARVGVDVGAFAAAQLAALRRSEG